MLNNLNLNIRKVNDKDVLTIFNWRNSSYIVGLGSLGLTVTWEEHLNWFNETLKENKRKAFILEVNGKAAGQIRFDQDQQSTCFISVYLSEEFSGRGYGIDFIKQGCTKLFSEWTIIKNICALVKNDNEIGQKAFVKSGFVRDVLFEDDNHLFYILKRKDDTP